MSEKENFTKKMSGQARQSGTCERERTRPDRGDKWPPYVHAQLALERERSPYGLQSRSGSARRARTCGSWGASAGSSRKRSGKRDTYLGQMGEEESERGRTGGGGYKIQFIRTENTTHPMCATDW